MNPKTEAHLHLTSRGPIKGTRMLSPENRPKCLRFGGIPYALPLDSTQRWRRAQPLPADFLHGSEANPADYSGLANEAPQNDVLASRMDEDCLQCNVWVPVSERPVGGWPVFVYLRT